jgi:molybdenum cofactor cytidylyltransferase
VIPGIILAAGRSTRMGASKALLPIAHDRRAPTFVTRIATTLLEGGAIDVVVVVRGDDRALHLEVDALGTRARCVVNAHADDGQLSSLIAGLDAVDRPGVHGIILTPVDVPFVRVETVRALIADAASGRAPIVRPTHRGRHGHPVFFARAVFDEVRHADPSVGAKAVIRAHAHDLIDLEVDDPGVLHDIDSPDDYARIIDPAGPARD